MFSKEFKIIKIDNIKKNNKYLFSYPIKDENLKNSIEKLGIISPLIVEEENDGLYNIISGFKRFFVATNFLDELPCVILNDKINDFEKIKISIEENTFFGKKVLNEIEKSNIVYNLCNFFNLKPEEIKYICEISGIPISKFNIDKNLTIHKFSDDIKNRIFKKNLSLEAAFDMQFFDDELKRCILKILDELKLNYNLSKEFVKYLKNIYDNSGISDFKNNVINKIMIVISSDLGIKQKIEDIRKFLYEKMHPDIYRKEQNFLVLKNKIENKDISLFHTDYFENDNMVLNITFREANLSDLKINIKNILDKIKK